MAYFDANTTFRQMWMSMGKNIDWANGPEGQKLLQTIKTKGSSPSFGTGNLYSDFQNDLLTGNSTVRNQVADMYKKHYGLGDSSAPASPQPSSSSRSSALTRTRGRGGVVRQSAPTSTNAGTPSSNGGGLVRTSRHQGGARARPGVSIRGGGVPMPGNPGGYGTPRATPKPSSVPSSAPTPKPSNVASSVRTAAGIGRGLVGGLGKLAGGGLLLLDGYETARDLAGSLQRGEGYAALPGLISNAFKGNGSQQTQTKSRASGLTFDKDGRPYITIDGRRVYQGDTASEQVSRVTGPDGKELIADPENPGFLLTEDGRSVRGDLTGGAGPISEDKDTGFVRPSDPKPPSTPAPPTTEAPKTRTNENGIEQKGKSLSSSDLSSLGILDAARFWEGGTHVSGGDTPPLGSKVINVGGKDMEISGDDLIEYEEAVTEAGSTGLVPQATASKPAAPGTPWSNVELTEDDEQYVSPIYENAARNAARSAFLNAPAGKGAMSAINARNRAVGGDDAHGFNVGGKHYQWADGVDQKQRTEAMYQLSGGVGNTREGFEGFAQEFLKDYMQKPEVKDTQEAGAGLVAHTPEKGEFPGYSSPTVSTPRKGPAITTDEDETAEFSYNSSKPSYASQRNIQEIGFN